jgi:hypothetical protein
MVQWEAGAGIGGSFAHPGEVVGRPAQQGTRPRGQDRWEFDVLVDFLPITQGDGQHLLRDRMAAVRVGPVQRRLNLAINPQAKREQKTPGERSHTVSSRQGRVSEE